jgi:hypothetical protein
MKLCLKILAIAIIAASTFPLMSCAAPATFTYQNVSVALTVTACASCNGLTYVPAPYPQPIFLPEQQVQQLLPGTITESPAQGGSQLSCIQMGAIVTNAPPNVIWSIYPTPTLTIPFPIPSGGSYPVNEPIDNTGISTAQTNNPTQVGTLNSASGLSNFWCPPPVPIYTGAALQSAALAPIPPGWNGPTWTGVPQGDVEVVAAVPLDPSNPNACAVVTSSTCVYQAALFQVYNLTGVSILLFPKSSGTVSALTLTHGTSNTYQFNGTVVGDAPCLASPVGSVFCANGQLVSYTDNTIVWQIAPSNNTGVPTFCSTPVIAPQLSNCPATNTNTYGTITPGGLYTAPPNVPPGGIEPVIIAVAHGASATTAPVYITIN